MTAEEIKRWRDDFYNALVEITDFGSLSLPKEQVLEEYKRKAYGCSDAEIEESAKYNTPTGAAEFETM